MAAGLPECVAYGFFPVNAMDLVESYSLMHGVDERIAVADLGLAAAFYADLMLEMLRRPHRCPTTSCALAAWPCATGCSCTGRRTGPRPCATMQARSGWPGPKPDLGGKAADGVPGVRGVLKLAEAMAVIPLVKRACRRRDCRCRICRPSAR